MSHIALYYLGKFPYHKIICLMFPYDNMAYSNVPICLISVNETPGLMRREILLFLSRVHIVHNSLHHARKESESAMPYWVTKYNYLSLLNLPETMYNYGPLINLWEGSNRGEGYLRYAKPMIINIHSKNWQANAIKKLQSKKALDSVVEHHCLNCFDDVGIIDNYLASKGLREPKMFVEYRTVKELYNNIRRKLPISCVGLSNGLYFAVIQKKT